MPRLLIVLLLLFALSMAVTWWGMSGLVPAGVAPPGSGAIPAGPAPAADRVAGASGAAAARADERDAVPAAGGAPERVDAIDVLVLERQNLAPVAGAEVVFLVPPLRRDEARDALMARDPEAAARQFGESRRTDADGRTRIPRLVAGAVFARKGDLQGLAVIVWERVPAGGLRILVSPDVEVKARVVDDAGAPVSGAMVWLDVRPAERGGEAVESMRRTTGAGGEVRFPSVQNKLDHHQAAHSAPLHLSLRCTVPGFESPPVVVYGSGKRPSDPVLFTLPPMGSMRLRVRTAKGRPWRAKVRLSLQVGASVPVQERIWVSTEPDGELLLRHVGLDREFAVNAYVGGATLVRTVRGPTRPGTTATVDVALPEASVFLRGRALDARGDPISGVEFFTMMKAGGRQVGVQAEADEEGRFEFALNDVAGYRIGEVLLRVLTQREEYKDLVATRRLDRVPEAGPLDLGDVVFERPRVLARGKLLGAVEGRSLGLFVESFDPRGETWETDLGVSVHREPPDRLEFRGVSRARRMRVKVSSLWYQAIEPVEFAPGAEDVLVRLHEGVSLNVGVDAGFKIPPGLLQLRLTPHDGGALRPARRAGTVRALREGFGGPAGYEGERYMVMFLAVPPGRHELHGYVAGNPAPVVYIPDVEVSVERPLDPRLDPLDLRGKLRPVTVTAVDAATGAPLEDQPGCVFVAGARPEEALEGCDLMRGRATLVLPAERRVELRVMVPGYTEEHLVVTGAEHSVRLQRPAERPVEIRVEGAAGREGQLLVRAAPHPRSDASRATLRYGETVTPRTGALSDLIGTKPVEARVGADGRAVFALVDGVEYALEVVLDRGGAEELLRIDGPRRVRGGAERFALRVVPR